MDPIPTKVRWWLLAEACVFGLPATLLTLMTSPFLLLCGGMMVVGSIIGFFQYLVGFKASIATDLRGFLEGMLMGLWMMLSAPLAATAFWRLVWVTVTRNGYLPIVHKVWGALAYVAAVWLWLLNSVYVSGQTPPLEAWAEPVAIAAGPGIVAFHFLWIGRCRDAVQNES